MFANLEDELMRQEEEENQIAQNPMQYLASLNGVSDGRNNISSSNANNEQNEIQRVHEDPMNEDIDNEEIFDREENVIVNMDMINDDGQDALVDIQQPLPQPPLQANDQADLGIGGQRSRDIIASIEADILRRQQEESRAEINFNRGMFRNQMVIGPYSSHFYPRTLASRRVEQPNLMLNMMMQQHRQHAQPFTARSNFLNQVSNMGIEPIDEISINSIESCISYDGKNTNIFSIPCQTHEQDMACQMLNTAVNDLVNAPVLTILRE